MKEKEIPVLWESKDHCCGCTACMAACPVDAISMEPDEEGFLYPAIDPDRCIRCGKCVRSCIYR